MREKLTVLVPSFNEEGNIEGCLKGLTWADEILVVDSYSTDRTVELARQYTDRVLQHEYVNSAAQKNWAIPLAAHQWVLVVDCDERVSPELRQEIESVLADPQGFDGFIIPRRNIFLGRPIRYCGWGPGDDTNVRLFKRDKGRYENKEVHADVVVDGGRVGKLRSPFVHRSYRNISHYLEKIHRYTDWSAGDVVKKGKPVGADKIILRPLATFFRMYVLKLGFLDGFHGLVLCALSSYYVMLKYVKAWERLRLEKWE
ncbi:MAG: glycosyltransferase family 2 protein [Deltaproteobacteria bacterium]|nr:glycosyltransferase family 2 protein [Deltaproteobacteria bacterium]